VTSWGAREVGFVVFFCVETIGLLLLVASSSWAFRVIGGLIIVGAYLVAWFPELRRSIDRVKQRDRDADPRRGREDSTRDTD